MILWLLLRELLTVLGLPHARDPRSLLRGCGRITAVKDRRYSREKPYDGSLG